jgi:hypothetical protein
MRGRVCRLQLLLVLASAVILRSESRATHDHILLSQIRDSPNLEGQVPVFISPRHRVAGYKPRHWGPFSSPPMTRLLFLFHFYNGKVGLTVSVTVLFNYKNENMRLYLAWLHGLLFDPVNGDSTFLQNVGNFYQNARGSHPRNQSLHGAESFRRQQLISHSENYLRTLHSVNTFIIS